MINKIYNTSIFVAGEEAECSQGTEAPVPPPPRQLRVVEGREGEVIQPSKTLRVLAKVSLVLAGIIFFCQVSEGDLLLLCLKVIQTLNSTFGNQHMQGFQSLPLCSFDIILDILPQVVVAACLCRPVVVMGGVWVGVLVLVQAVLGLRAPSSHAL